MAKTGRKEGMRQASRFSPTLQPQSGSVVAWRAARLLAAGFESELAESLAADGAVDLHALLELVDGGCPPVLAARILAPLDEQRRPA
jgi:hypothetical protein